MGGLPALREFQVKLPQIHLLRDAGINYSKLFYNYVYREFNQINGVDQYFVDKSEIENILTKRN